MIMMDGRWSAELLIDEADRGPWAVSCAGSSLFFPARAAPPPRRVRGPKARARGLAAGISRSSLE